MKRLSFTITLLAFSFLVFATKSENAINELLMGMSIERVKSICGEPSYSVLDKESNTRMLLFSFYNKNGGGYVEYHMYLTNDKLSKVVKLEGKEEVPVNLPSINDVQDEELTGKIYQKKLVVEVENSDATALYLRALEALSDWAGSQQRSKANVDLQDKEKGLVVYKGQLYLGYGKQNFMYGWHVFANFTSKVRCKDGKAQITLTIPSLTYYWTGSVSEVTVPISQVWPDFNYTGNMLIKKATYEVANNIPAECNTFIQYIAYRLSKQEEDDF